ncbi:PQQ-binding-like beta-propeller repeat protein [Streptomyces sp. NRRL F-5126]|uniref:outer membrane protein assembly factor BamB family protein n=1 Tax=Streptomyces sp. NRRL F-5126 TaxID=1463857 RepID=UPI000A84EF8E|nr:PQQ-binding-like beta-propeller repeat protein [Streptomyces sp. NRRL F-5126]
MRLSSAEAPGTCLATAHQVVCSAAPDGLVGRSRATGAVTWRVPGSGTGKNGGLVIAAGAARAVTSSGRTLRAADLRTGRQAWSHRLPAGHTYTGAGSDGTTVFAYESGGGPAGRAGSPPTVLAAFRGSDGTPLWHKTVAAAADTAPTAFGGRVYTTDGARVTARDNRTGAVLATSPRGAECPALVSGGHYLVCTGSPYSASDIFPPVRRLDPASLQPLSTVPEPSMMPRRGMVSPDGVLMLFETSAEDPGAGTWEAYDLGRPRKLWSYATTTDEGALCGERFATFTPAYGPGTGRLITFDLHAGPHGTGSEAPRQSATHQETRWSERPAVIVPDGGSGHPDPPGHVVVEGHVHHTLRSIATP